VCMNSADCSGFRVVGDKRNLLEFTIARVWKAIFLALVLTFSF
jgi:hypothetical protein